MGFLAVLIAAAAAFAFGAIWYMRLSAPWIADSGVPVGADGRPVNGSSPLPYAGSFLCIVLVAGMMRHSFATSGIDGLFEGLVGGLGIGLFFITPWIAINNLYAARPVRLTLIDGGYATIGCTIIGTILALFA